MNGIDVVPDAKENEIPFPNDGVVYAGQGRYYSLIEPGEVILSKELLRDSYIAAIDKYLSRKADGAMDREALQDAVNNTMGEILE